MRRLAAIFALLVSAPATARPTVEVVYWDSPIDAECNGEPIRYYGEVELRRHERAGGVSTSISYRWLEAVGTETGLEYQVTGAFHDGYRQDGAQSVETYVNRLHFVAPGGGRNVFYDELLHVTVSPGGELTVTQDRFSVECR